jgi:hypothetical protein
MATSSKKATGGGASIRAFADSHRESDAAIAIPPTYPSPLKGHETTVTEATEPSPSSTAVIVEPPRERFERQPNPLVRALVDHDDDAVVADGA